MERTFRASLRTVMTRANVKSALKAAIFAAWRNVAALGRPSTDENRRRLEQRGERPSSITIREASRDDIPAIARVHVTAWNDTYAPLRVRGPALEVREEQWRQLFARPDSGWFCFVAASSRGEVVGFAKANESDNPDYGGELNKIYLLREYQGLGIGRRLVGHVARRFLEQGITSMWLFGDARNPSAYVWRALGAVKTDDDPGNGNYGWRDLKTLAERCPID